ncbi:MOSC domain-containing protein [Streptomyces sp. NPDC053513]|uniref:MOSC domain-containing protein n=1 Tax=unclassified Streptomyces TaxID=2593676 RepID=UPI0037D2BD53
MAKVVELTYFPVKGCAGLSVQEASMTPAGLPHDRSFMVVDENGVFRSQRRDPRLALIRPSVEADGTRLTLEAPGFGTVTVPVDSSSERRPVELFGAAFTGIDQGDEAAAWLSAVTGGPSRLVRVPPEHERITDGLVAGTSGYADSCAVHVVSRSSMAALNERLVSDGAEPLPISRFRPNIVVDGWDDPHTEDLARRITVGSVELAYAKLAIRCAVTLVDQRSGCRSGREPIRTLATYRRAAQGGVAFGVKLAVVRPGRLSVGDDVTVSSWGASELHADSAVTTM